MININETIRLEWDKSGYNLVLKQYQKVTPKGKGTSRMDWITLGYYPSLSWFKNVCDRSFTLLTRGIYDKRIRFSESETAKENWTNEKKFAKNIATPVVAQGNAISETRLGPRPVRKISAEHVEKMRNGKRTGKAKASPKPARGE